MNQYRIEIPNAGVGTYRVITNILFLINLVVFGALLFVSGSRNLPVIICVAGSFLNAFALIAPLMIKPQSKISHFRSAIILFMTALLWILYGKVFIGFMMIVFAIAGIYANRNLFIDFNAAGILFPSIKPRLIPWNEVEHVICKDGMLSIDLKNNKLLQFNISTTTASQLDERAFNDFCQKFREATT